MARRRADSEQGFVITLELVLIMSILGIGLLVGIIAIRNALFVWWQKKKANTVWVFDSSTPIRVLGPARDFDEHEAPRLFYIDRDVDWCVPFNPANPADPCDIATDVTRNYRAFIGVRDDRFTGRHRIFYTDSLDCGATFLTDNGDDRRACITAVSAEDEDSFGIGQVTLTIDGTTSNAGTFSVSQTLPIAQAGGQGYLYALQQGPTYGVGADIDQTFNSLRLPGTLYRQTMDTCTDSANDIVIRSMWTSQTVVSGEPCVPLPAGIVVTSAKCPVGQDGPEIGGLCNQPPSGNVDSRCVTAGTCSISGNGCATDAECGPGGGTCDTGTLQCACPLTANGIFADNWDEVGANCCPPGTSGTTPAGQCVIGTDGQLWQAEPVLGPGGVVNAFADLHPPFRVNLPPDPDSFFLLTPPGGEGGGFGTIGNPYDPANPTGMDFEVDAAGGEAGPP